MDIPCKACGAQNPATNRFCGQCGSRLRTPSLADSPEEFWRDAPAKPLDTSAAEVNDFFHEIPLFEGKDINRHLQQPSGVASEVQSRPEQDAGLGDLLQYASGTHPSVPAREVAALKPPATTAEHSSSIGVSGPSFLGLSGGPSDYLLEEDEPPSHMRRNIAIAVLLAAAILLGLQWRSVRDYGLGYVQNGSMQVKPHTKDEPRNPPAIAADNTGRDLGLPPAAAKASSPKPVESSPNADRNSQLEASPSATSSAASSTQPPSMSAPAPDLPRNNAATETPEAAPPRSPAKPHTSRPERNVARTAPLPGADEMNRAERASDAEARAAWLWRAVGKGNPQAPVELARMYEMGNGVVRSCDQAQILLRSAAAKRNEQARLGLQQMRMRGCR